MGRRPSRLGSSTASEKDGGSGLEFERIVGTVAEQMITKGVKASVLVIQAGGKGLEM